jgi:hypothetical protein
VQGRLLADDSDAALGIGFRDVDGHAA